MKDLSNTIHFYGQEMGHDDVFVIGDTESLTKLRDVLNEVLGGIEKTSIVSFANDGEGYNINILCPKEEKILENLMLPYNDNEYINFKDKINPWHLVYEKKIKFDV